VNLLGKVFVVAESKNTIRVIKQSGGLLIYKYEYVNPNSTVRFFLESTTLHTVHQLMFMSWINRGSIIEDEEEII
jgi:hypothetical protein